MEDCKEPVRPVEGLVEPRLHEHDNGDESFMTSDPCLKVIPRDPIPNTSGVCPVPAQRTSLSTPAERRSPPPIARRSQRPTASQHSNLYNLLKSVCNAVSFIPDIWSQVLAGMVMYTSEKRKVAVDGLEESPQGH